MKTKNIVLIVFFFATVGYAQTPIHKRYVIDHGGGKSISDNIVLRSFIGQPNITRMVNIDTGNIIQSGFVNIQREYSGVWMVYNQSFAEGWDLASLPVMPFDPRKTSLYSTGSSNAFSYNGSYFTIDTIKNSEGFWIKYSIPTQEELMGTSYFFDTVNVFVGWNMIGSLTYPVVVDNIESDPSGIIESGFFGYDGSYYSTDTLKPSMGYWVKVNQGGKLILSSP